MRATCVAVFFLLMLVAAEASIFSWLTSMKEEGHRHRHSGEYKKRRDLSNQQLKMEEWLFMKGSVDRQLTPYEFGYDGPWGR